MKISHIVIVLVCCGICKCVNPSESAPSQNQIPDSDPITINIDHTYNVNNISLYKDQLNDLYYRKYTPNSGKFITSVVDSKGSVWRAESNEGCIGLHVCANSSFSTIILLSIERDGISDTKYLEHHGISWIPITEATFKIRFEEMKLKTPPSGRNSLNKDKNNVELQVIEANTLESCGCYVDLIKLDTFDMTNINPNNFCTIKDSFSGVESIGYLPQYCVKKVVDGYDVVWEAAENETKCTNIEFYSNKTTTIVVLLINKNPGPNECKLFEYFDKKWVMVPNSEFESKVNSMKNKRVERECLRCKQQLRELI